MKDLIGREVQVGNYICYALTAGRSANLAVYQVKEVMEDKIKAVKLESSYGNEDWLFTINKGTSSEKQVLYKYVKWNCKLREHTEMTDEEKYKVDNKTSTLSMPERIFILDGFTADLFK